MEALWMEHRSPTLPRGAGHQAKQIELLRIFSIEVQEGDVTFFFLRVGIKNASRLKLIFII